MATCCIYTTDCILTVLQYTHSIWFQPASPVRFDGTLSVFLHLLPDLLWLFSLVVVTIPVLILMFTWFLSSVFSVFPSNYFSFSAWKSGVWSAIGLTHSWQSVWSVSHTPQQVSLCRVRLRSLCSWNPPNQMWCFQLRKPTSIRVCWMNCHNSCGFYITFIMQKGNIAITPEQGHIKTMAVLKEKALRPTYSDWFIALEQEIWTGLNEFISTCKWRVNPSCNMLLKRWKDDLYSISSHLMHR